MGFNFATAPNDYALRAQAGLPLDPNLTPDQVSALAAQSLAAPPPPAAAPSQALAQPQADPSGATLAQPYKPSTWDIIQGMLFNGGGRIKSPNEASVEALQRHYALQQQQMLMDTLAKATPQQRQAILFNSAKYGESLAKNFEPINAAEGTTETMFGGASQPGGSSSIAPKMMLGPAGQPIALTQNGVVSLGPQLAGKKVADHGLVTDENLGVIGNYATLPTVAGMIYPGIPGYSGGAAAPPTAGGAVLSGFGLPGGNPPASGVPAAQATAPAPAAPPGKFDALNFIKSFILPHEGGLNPHDMNGAPTKFGINQAANPGVNVPNLTADQATDIYLHKYLPASGAANLPPALAAVHLDTSIINPARAQQFLQQSGGDPAKYLQLRQAWMDHMVQTNPAAAPYAKAWAQRNADLGQIIAGNGAQGAPNQGGASPPAQNGDVATQIGQPIGRSGMALTPQERQTAGFSPSDRRQAIWDASGNPQVINPEFGPKEQLDYTKAVTEMDPYKNYTMARQYVEAMRDLMKQPGGFADLSLIENAGKTINPTLAIRPNMIEQYGKETGWPDWLIGQVSSVVNHGGHLTQEGRNALMNIAQTNLQSHWVGIQPILKKVDHDAAKYGVQREDLIPDLVPMPDKPSPAYPGAAVPHSLSGGAPPASAPVAVQTPQEAMRLPPGTPIRLPDGRLGTVPAR